MNIDPDHPIPYRLTDPVRISGPSPELRAFVVPQGARLTFTDLMTMRLFGHPATAIGLAMARAGL